MSECLPATLKHRIVVLGTNGNLLSVGAACEHNRLTVQGRVCSRTVDTGHAIAGRPIFGRDGATLNRPIADVDTKT
jgi:hypothetical protein